MAQGFVLVKKKSPKKFEPDTQAGTHVEGKLGVPVVGF